MSDGVRTPGDSAPPTEPGGAQALLLVCAGLLLAGGWFVWVGLALEIAAVLLGLRTMRRAARSGRRAPGAKAAVVTGSVAALLLVAVLGFLALVYDEYRAYTTCLDRAITESARAECRETFDGAVRSRFGVRG